MLIIACCFGEEENTSKRVNVLVARSEFTEGEEDAIDHSKRADVLRLGELLICARHDEPYDSLECHTKGK